MIYADVQVFHIAYKNSLGLGHNHKVELILEMHCVLMVIHKLFLIALCKFHNICTCLRVCLEYRSFKFNYYHKHLRYYLEEFM